MVTKSPTPEVQALILRSQTARENLGQAAEILRAKLDAPARMRASILANPGRWLAGATAAGLVTSRLLFRRPKSIRTKKSLSIPFLLMRMTSNAIMPAVKIFLLAQIKAYLSRRNSGPQNSSSY